MSNLSFTISRRLKIGSGSNSSRIGSIIAIAGVACSLAVMIVTLAISVGFKQQIRAKVSGFNPTVSINAPYSYDTGRQERFVTLDGSLEGLIKDNYPSLTPSLSLIQPAIIKTDKDFHTILINGFDSRHDFSFERDNMVEGTLPDFESENSDSLIVISKYIANKLDIKLGDRITCCFFIDDNVKMRRYTVSGLYTSDFGEYDNTIAYGSLSGLQQLNDVDRLTGSSVALSGDIPTQDIAPLAADLQTKLIARANQAGLSEVEVVDNVMHTGALYLNWLELLDTNVVVIFILMCCVAAMTLISSLFIIILDKTATIGVIRSLGGSKRFVRNIFIFTALRLVGLGLIIGNFVALGFVWLQSQYHIIPMNPEMYYLSAVPVSINLWQVVSLNIGVIIFAWLVLILPSRLASSISPAKTMRYE
jgi:lipoprotein-releasing system permease protein